MLQLTQLFSGKSILGNYKNEQHISVVTDVSTIKEMTTKLKTTVAVMQERLTEDEICISPFSIDITKNFYYQELIYPL